MMKSPPPASPDAYVDTLTGWSRDLVQKLRDTVGTVSGLQEVVKWGHLVYVSNGPVLLIRAEETRVLFGFWRGQLLRGIEPRLKAGGKYEMATIELRDGDSIHPETVRRLAVEATTLNAKLGNPTEVARA